MGSIAAFAPGSNISSRPNSKFMLNAIPTPEASAQALTNYMAKAHEAKIAALKVLEDKKNAEIKALKESSSSSSSSSTPSEPAATSATGESVDDMTQKILSYQKFMADYIVKAQDEKAKAVKAAEDAIAKKYEDKLNAFMLNGAAPPSNAPAIAIAAVSEESEIYQKRNAKIAAAAKAGKSRWGDKEVERAGAKAPPSEVIVATPVDAADAASSIAAADHGLRADGGVGGLSLAERVMNGSAATVTVAEESEIYQKRNAKIAASAKAGKSRWGDKEVERAGAKAPPSEVIVATPVDAADAASSIAAADHGLRADGGVGGLSLAERVMNGSAATVTVAVANGASESTAAPASAMSAIFYKRNAFIAAAEKAGKSTRWGSEEAQKAIEYTSNNLPPAPKVEIEAIPEVEAADHGLRADGGVGGPSLAERVNLGAKLLQ